VKFRYFVLDEGELIPMINPGRFDTGSNPVSHSNQKVVRRYRDGVEMGERVSCVLNIKFVKKKTILKENRFAKNYACIS
jgi:hypothetical protein